MFVPGTPVEWHDEKTGAIRYGIIQKRTGIGYSVLVHGGRRQLVGLDKVAISLD